MSNSSPASETPIQPFEGIEIATLNDQLAHVQELRDGLPDLVERDVLTQTAADDMYAQYTEEIEAIEERLEDLS